MLNETVPSSGIGETAPLYIAIAVILVLAENVTFFLAGIGFS